MDNQKEALDPHARKKDEKGRCLMRIWLSEKNMIGVETVPGMPLDAALDLLSKSILTIQNIKREKERENLKRFNPKGGYIASLKNLFARKNA